MPMLQFTPDEMTGSNYLGEGTHKVILKDVTERKSQKGNTVYEMTLTNGVKERVEYVTYTDNMKWKLGQILGAFGFEPNAPINFPSDVLGRSCYVTVAKTGVFPSKKDPTKMVDRHEVVEWAPDMDESTPDFGESEIG